MRGFISRSNVFMISIEFDENQIATYAAIVATIGVVAAAINLFFYIHSIRRDRSKIKIQYNDKNRVIGAGPVYDEDKEYFQIIVTNKGRRPIKIDRAGVRVIDSDKPSLLSPDSFQEHRNKVLDEKEPTIYFLIDNSSINLDKAWYIFVYDGFGKKHRKYLHKFPTFWRIRQWITNKCNFDEKK